MREARFYFLKLISPLIAYIALFQLSVYRDVCDACSPYF